MPLSINSKESECAAEHDDVTRQTFIIMTAQTNIWLLKDYGNEKLIWQNYVNEFTIDWILFQSKHRLKFQSLGQI